MTLAEVPTAELLEVHLVNAVAPFVLNARLKPLLAAVPTRDAHVVNVSAMEGQFYRRWKTDKHPHTNMAKAALNMMTRTSAADYVRDGIHMNSVDTGWVTDEDPLHHAERKQRDPRLPSAARHRRRRGAHRRSDLRRAEHGQARVGAVPEGLQAGAVVTPAAEPPRYVPRVEREQYGRSLRDRVKRVDQAQWVDRRSRHARDGCGERGRPSRRAASRSGTARWRRSPFGFLRGAAWIMAPDLAAVPHTGYSVQICGDAHVRNLGAFASAGRPDRVRRQRLRRDLPRAVGVRSQAARDQHRARRPRRRRRRTRSRATR